MKSLAGDNAILTQLAAELEKEPSTLRAANDILERATRLANQLAASLANREEELKD
ncbi:MAG: hypothetical protein IPK15_26105 [Verrucomicrobia bacterium]|nr:hypothetical protein [Verrucomicrobiota bacterium]